MKHTLPNPMTNGQQIFGLCYLVAQQFAIPYLLMAIVLWLRLPISDLWLNFVLFLVNFLVVVTVFARFLEKDLRLLGKGFWPAVCTCVTGFVLYWAANMLLSICIAIYFPGFSNANDTNIQSMADKQFPLMFIGTVLLVPTVEETLYRGVIYGSLQRHSRVLACAVSTVLFAAVHVISYIGAVEPLYLLISVLQYIPAGLCLAWAYAQSGTIFVPILIHTAVNLVGMLAMR